MVYIEATFASGEQFIGSGAVVGQNDVLTAPHVIYSALYGDLAETSGWAADIYSQYATILDESTAIMSC